MLATGTKAKEMNILREAMMQGLMPRLSEMKNERIFDMLTQKIRVSSLFLLICRKKEKAVVTGQKSQKSEMTPLLT